MLSIGLYVPGLDCKATVENNCPSDKKSVFYDPHGYLRVLNLKDENGEQIFHAADVSLFELWGINITDVENLVNVKDKDGHQRFDRQGIIDIAKGHVPLEYVNDLVNKEDECGKRLTGFKMRRLYQLGFDKDDLTDDLLIRFEDTSKPNAIIDYTTDDPWCCFEGSASLNFFKKIQDSYDVYVLLGKDEDEMYKSIELIDDSKLFIVAAHGERDKIQLGEGMHEKYRIDFSDTELSDYLDKLSPDAVIFLSSCYTAEEGDGKNLADFVVEHAGGRKVIASKASFESKDIVIKSLYPFDVEIIVKGKNVTYSNK